MEILQTRPEQLKEVFRLYEAATERQKQLYKVHWPVFEEAMVAREIAEGRQWHVRGAGRMCCTWAIAFEDLQIWEESAQEAALYLHRIATLPQKPKVSFVPLVIAWAKAFAQARALDFVRLDTIGHNQKLIAHYQACGFAFLGLRKLQNTQGLPAHYQEEDVSLFEIKL